MNKILNFLEYSLNMIINFIIFISLVSMTLIVLGEVFTRFILGFSLPWSTELARVIFLYLVFIGAIIASKRDEHISINVIELLDLPKLPQKIIDIIQRILVIILFVIVLRGAYDMLSIAGAMRLSATGLPRTYMTYPILIGAGGILIYSFGLLIKYLKEIYLYLREGS